MGSGVRLGKNWLEIGNFSNEGGEIGAWKFPTNFVRVSHVLGSKVPLFPYNRGWETQPNNRGLYTHYKDSLLKVG